MTTTPVVLSPRTPATPMFDGQGNLRWEWRKYFDYTAQAINSALTILGQFNGEIGAQATVAGRAGTLQTAIQHLTIAGELATTALTGIVAPAQLPTASVGAIGAVKASNVVADEWVDSIGAGGVPHTSQPGFGNLLGQATPPQVPNLNLLNGSVTAAHVPNLSALNGQVTAAQGPAAAFSGTIATAKLTGGGANGSMTFTNGFLTAQVAAT